ncbi:hypothetical protein [Bosea sp. NPDC055594]
MSAACFSWGPSQTFSNAVYPFQLMLIFLQELDGRRYGYRQGDKLDRLCICVHAYEAVIGRGSLKRYPFIVV